MIVWLTIISYAVRYRRGQAASIAITMIFVSLVETTERRDRRASRPQKE